MKTLAIVGMDLRKLRRDPTELFTRAIADGKASAVSIREPQAKEERIVAMRQRLPAIMFIASPTLFIGAGAFAWHDAGEFAEAKRMHLDAQAGIEEAAARLQAAKQLHREAREAIEAAKK
jgi:hypothetical protein